MKSNSKSDDISFLEHLEILRWYIIKALIVIVVLSIAAFVFHEIIFDYVILAPKTPDFFTNKILCRIGVAIGSDALCINEIQFQLININMAGQFTTHIMVSLVLGLILGFPYLLYQFWKFVEPALYEKEKKNAVGVIFFSSLLFFLGVFFGYYIITPLSVHFLGSYSVSSTVVNQINLSSYISTVSSIVLAAGIIFELPILLVFLSRAGLVTPMFLKQYRRHSFVVILILSAIITPPDIFSQILVAVPLFVLYESGIVISRRIYTKQQKAMV